jgi:transposase
VAKGRKTDAAKRNKEKKREKREPGFLAKADKKTLRSYDVGAMPIINHIIRRMRLPDILKKFLPDDPRSELPAYRTVLVLVRNLLIAREPIYGLSQWAVRFAPELLDLRPRELELLNDDRAGRTLDQMFDALASELTVTVVRQVIDEFRINMDELHNDSTSVSFYGAYDQAEEERQVRGQQTLAITYGHSKDHRPDLKQLLFILTVSDDGGVPIYFTSASGNTSDDTTHRQTWDLLCQLAGRSDFLYVADCKLASGENMDYIARKGRFITVLPRSRKEDKQFRKQLLEKPDSVRWNDVYTVSKKVRIKGAEQEVEVDRLTVVSDEMLSSDGYRLLWYHSTKKADHDARYRAGSLQRAIRGLTELRVRLSGPRTRFKNRKKVDEAVQEIVKRLKEESLLTVTVEEREEGTFRQASKGRPGKNTKYVKEIKKRFEISWSIDSIRMAEAEATDGIFPLISNVNEMTPEEILRAYKRQPIIEKRFSQLKTDFAVAPIYLKSVTRIQGLLAVYFLALIVQTLLERELRQAMERAKIESLPLYPEERACRYPTARKVIDLFDGVQRHELEQPGRETEVMVTELSPRQRQIVELLGISAKSYGRQ